MTTLLISLLIGIAAYALYLYNWGSKITPDGQFYLKLGSGEPVPTPYRYRWLLPRILKANVRAWNVVTGTSIVLTCPLIALYGGEVGLVAVLLWVGLPWFRLGVRYPVLTDAPAMLFTLAALVMVPHNVAISLLLVMIAASMRESTPVYAALFAWNPIFLLGLIPVAIAHFATKKGEIPPGAEWLEKPKMAAWESHAGKWLDPKWTLLPWGAALAALFHPHFWQAVPVLAMAYGQMLVANDFARLYQWAAPVVVVLAAQMIPGWAVLPLFVLHMYNLWANIEV